MVVVGKYSAYFRKNAAAIVAAYIYSERKRRLSVGGKVADERACFVPVPGPDVILHAGRSGVEFERWAVDDVRQPSMEALKTIPRDTVSHVAAVGSRLTFEDVVTPRSAPLGHPAPPLTPPVPPLVLADPPGDARAAAPSPLSSPSAEAGSDESALSAMLTKDELLALLARMFTPVARARLGRGPEWMMSTDVMHDVLAEVVGREVAAANRRVEARARGASTSRLHGK